VNPYLIRERESRGRVKGQKLLSLDGRGQGEGEVNRVNIKMNYIVRLEVAGYS